MLRLILGVVACVVRKRNERLQFDCRPALHLPYSKSFETSFFASLPIVRDIGPMEPIVVGCKICTAS
jgi:hypothetical protein